MSMSAVGLAATTSIAGIFGMNLVSGIEETPLAFAAVTAGSGLVGAAVVACVEIKTSRRFRYLLDGVAVPVPHRSMEASTAASSPRNDFVKSCRVYPTHCLISTQATTAAPTKPEPSVTVKNARGVSSIPETRFIPKMPAIDVVAARPTADIDK